MTKMKSARLGQERKVRTTLVDALMSNTVYVNKNYAFNDLHKMIFVSLPSAYDWILRFGAVSSKNKWRILCAPGEDTSIVTNPNVYVWDGGVGSIPLSNNVWVNTSYTYDNLETLVFMSPDTAYAWILANGNLSETNPWVINLPAGTISSVTLHQDVMYSCSDGTIIDNLYLDMTFADMGSIFRSYITGAIINNLVGAPLKCGYLYDCIIKGVTAIDDTFAEEDTEEENPLQCYVVINSCKVYAGDFQNYTVVDASFSSIISLIDNITNLSYFGVDVYISSIGVNNTIAVTGKVNQIGGFFNPSTQDGVNLTLTNASTEEIDISSGTVKFNGCVFQDLTISGGSVTTSGCVVHGTLSHTGGTWINKGELYSNSVSGLPDEDTQGAIDTLAAGTMNKLVEQVYTEINAWSRMDAVGLDNVGNNETITLNTGEADEEVYTFKTTLTEPAVPGEILIGASIGESISNAATVIDDESLIVSSSYTDPSCFITNKIAGSTGNGITVATTSAALSFLYPALQGGSDEYVVGITDGKYVELGIYDTCTIRIDDGGEDRCMEFVLTISMDDVGHDVTIVPENGVILWEGGEVYTPTGTANSIDRVRLEWNGTNWYGKAEYDYSTPA